MRGGGDRALGGSETGVGLGEGGEGKRGGRGTGGRRKRARPARSPSVGRPRGARDVGVSAWDGAAAPARPADAPLPVAVPTRLPTLAPWVPLGAGGAAEPRQQRPGAQVRRAGRDGRRRRSAGLRGCRREAVPGHCATKSPERSGIFLSPERPRPSGHRLEPAGTRAALGLPMLGVGTGPGGMDEDRGEVRGLEDHRGSGLPSPPHLPSPAESTGLHSTPGRRVRTFHPVPRVHLDSYLGQFWVG